MTTEILASLRNAALWKTSLLLGAVNFILTLYCLELIKVSGNISPIWFSTALMTVVAFRQRADRLLPVMLCCVAAIMLANTLFFGLSLNATLTYPLINLLQALAGAGLLTLTQDRKHPLSTLSGWYKMMLTVGVCTPLLGGLLALLLMPQSANQEWQFFFTWVISEAIGMLALGPVCMLWQPGWFRRELHRRAKLEAILTLAATLLLCYVALRFLPWPFTFVIVILFWSAVRLPRLEAFVVFLATICMMSWMLAFKLFDLRAAGQAFTPSAPWLPFLLALIPGHMMTMVMNAFREEKKHITESENRFRNAMEYSAIGMALVSTSGKWLQVNKALCKLLGYDADELKRMNFQQLSHPDDLNADLEQLVDLLAGEINSYTLEKRYFRKDGERVWARLSVSLARDSDQEPLYFISQIEDITELKQTAEINRQLMERITLANEAGGVGVWEWNLTSEVISWDKRSCEIFELLPPATPTIQFWLESIMPQDQQKVEDAVQHTLETQEPLNIEYRIRCSQGERHVRSQATCISREDGKIERMLGVNLDITQISQLNDALFREQERMMITLDSIGEAVITTDEEMQVIFMNPVAEKMSGWTLDQAAGQQLSALLHITHGRDGPEMESLLLCTLPSAKTTPDFEQDLVLHNRRGEQFAIHYSITPLTSPDGRNVGSVMVIHDVSESRELLKRLSYSASHDMLTRLPNRSSFEHQLKRLLLSASEHRHQHVLCFIDLDRFKAINDTAGHAAGDALLRELARLMQSQLRGSDMLARLGGDEFGLLFSDCTTEQASEVVQQLVTSINEYRFLWENRLYRVGASAGLTQIHADNCQNSEVMAQADIACYNAKHNGRGQLAIYEARQQRLQRTEMTQEESQRIISENPLRLMVWAVAPPRKTQSVSLWLAELQLFSSSGHEIEEAEFRHTLQTPALCIALDRKVIATFYSHYAAGIAGKAIGIALPLSACSLKDDDFVDELVSRISGGPVSGNLLWFMLESAAVLAANPLLRSNISRLRQLGCGIIVRHFGRNLDAFALLPADEIDYLMLSADLVSNVHCNLMDEMMVSIMCGHAQRLNIAIIAGPVELPVALTTLTTIGVDVVWGNAVASREPLNALLNHSYFAIK